MFSSFCLSSTRPPDRISRLELNPHMVRSGQSGYNLIFMYNFQIGLGLVIFFRELRLKIFAHAQCSRSKFLTRAQPIHRLDWVSRVRWPMVRSSMNIMVIYIPVGIGSDLIRVHAPSVTHMDCSWVCFSLGPANTRLF